MCRVEAHELSSHKEQLEKLGVRLLAVVKEAIPEQVQQFRGTYWSGELYIDEDLGFFKALGGGTVQSKGLFALASSAVRANNKRIARPTSTILLLLGRAQSTQNIRVRVQGPTTICRQLAVHRIWLAKAGFLAERMCYAVVEILSTSTGRKRSEMWLQC